MTLASFLPQVPKDNMTINVIVLILTFVVLTKSADYLVDGAIGIAVKMNVSKVFIGVVLVGFGTTTPEFVVSVISAMKKMPDMALGNALGSIAANSGIALALAVLFAPTIIRIPKRFLNTTGTFLLVVSFISFGLSLSGKISRSAGIIHLVLLVAYLVASFIAQKRDKEQSDLDVIEEEGEEEVEEQAKTGGTGKHLMLFAVGLVGVIIASKFLVGSAENIAVRLGVPEIIIGLTIVAVGTSLPEIATCIIAARKGHGELAFGDIIGANILNLLWIVGAAATVEPIEVAPKIIQFIYPATLFIIMVKLGLARHKYRLHKWKAIVLLVTYIIYMSILVTKFGVGAPKDGAPPLESADGTSEVQKL